MTDLFDPPASAAGEIAQDFPRNGRMQPMIIPPGGSKPVPYTRATTFVDALDDKSGLMKWKARMASIGLASRPDLQLAIASTELENKRELDRIVEQALEAAKASAAATTGTALHQLTERIDLGLGIDGLNLPDEHRASLDAYRTMTEGIDWYAIEQRRVCHRHKVAGTADRVAIIDGKATILDIKTGSIDYALGKIAMQLAMYAHSQPYDVKTSTTGEDPAPVNLDRALIIHLPAGKGECTLHWVDIAAGWEAVELAAQVRQWRSRSRHLSTPAGRAEIIGDHIDYISQVAQFTDYPSLLDWYMRIDSRGEGSPDLLQACITRKAELEAAS